MPNLKYAIAVLFCIAGTLGATTLLLQQSVGEPTFCFLILASIFVGLWIAYSDRVKQFSLGLGKMTMVLTEIRSAQREVQDSERRMKRLAAEIVTLVERLEKSAIVDHTFDQAAFKKAKDEVKENTT